jgi:hypothetical protein
MSIRNVITLFILLSASACASENSFKNEQEFASYVSQIGLSNLSMSSAVSKVTAEGFSCYPQKDTTYCIREIKELVCIQKQNISLLSSENTRNPLKVSTKLWLVCL